MNLRNTDQHMIIKLHFGLFVPEENTRELLWTIPDLHLDECVA